VSVIRGLFNEVEQQADGGQRLLFLCPGCKFVHGPTIGPGAGPRWTFNGDYERPVFTPSLLVRWTEHHPPVNAGNLEKWKHAPWAQHPVERACHSFIGCNGAAPGQIIFLGDCTHELAGKVVDIPPFDWGPD
jgi:hypothetical protein